KDKHRYFIKTDFSDYFNSIDTKILKEKLYKFLKPEDEELFILIDNLLNNPHVVFNNKTIKEYDKGVMAGTPLSGYLANIYMNDVDWLMYKKHIYYVRYADDVLILTN